MLNARLNAKPLYRWVWILFLMLGALSCVSTNELDDARQKYQASGDYASLQMLADHLKKGMSREQTEALLGPPGDTNSEGVYLYGSDRKEFVAENGSNMHVVLVLNFKDLKGSVANELQRWGFEQLGE